MEVCVKPDYSDWLTPEELAKEDAEWVRDAANQSIYRANLIMDVCREKNIGKVVEFGCGTGLIAPLLPGTVKYLGIDGNSDCTHIATQRNGEVGRVIYWNRDVRMGWNCPEGLACSFAVLKHFGLHEWVDVLSGILRSAGFGLFDVQMSHGDPRDDDFEFYHTWVDQKMLDEAVSKAGHRIVKTLDTHEDEHGIQRMVWTERVD